MKDISERLRTIGEDYDFHGNALIFEAADEIDRLRSLVEEQRLTIAALCEGTDGSTPAIVTMARQDVEIDRLLARLRDIENQAPFAYHNPNESREELAFSYQPEEGFIPLYTAPVPAIPEGYVVMPSRLSAENGAKTLLMGEFFEGMESECPDCEGDGCYNCGDKGYFVTKIPVSWTTIKEIYTKAVDHLAAAPQPEGDVK